MKNRQQFVVWMVLFGLFASAWPVLLSRFKGMAPVVDQASSHITTIYKASPQIRQGPGPISPQPSHLVPSNLTPHLASLKLSSFDLINSVADEEVFSGFASWMQRYEAVTHELDRQRLAREGVHLAGQRRAALESLIQADPRRALELRLPAEQRNKLPPSIQSLLETPIQAHGDLMVLATLPLPGQEGKVKPLSRTARINNARYEAFVYGRRSGEPSRTNIPLQGIALGALMAIEDYPIDGEADASLQAGLVAAASAPAETEKKLLFIRVDFSDLAGEPFSESAGASLINNVNAFYRENSYGKVGFALKGAGSEVTPTLRMPNTAAFYSEDELFDELRSDARAAARAAGYVLSDYDYDLICFNRISAWNWAGRGYVGGAGVWINDVFTAGVVAHELGHNFGLGHANFWQTQDYSVIGDQGISQEYGDKFDTMGDPAAGQKHFNARFKNVLNWLPATNIATVLSSATYTLWPQDSNQLLGIQALRIPKNSRTNYWVELRQKITANRWLRAGVGLRWASSDSLSTLLLDTTPGSIEGIEDSSILLGQTFSDYQAGIHITPVAVNPTTPPSLQIVVNRGPFPSNRAPILDLVASATQVLPGAEAVFEARGDDPDGDSLAYAWDLGDGSFGTNQTVIAKRWMTSGLYLVRCSVSDMKGGVTSGSVLVRVGHPDLWALSGQVLDDGKPLAGIRISASPSKVTWTDSNGRFTLAGLSSGSYHLVAGHDENRFLRPGFTNPLVVRTNLAGLDFLVPALPTSSRSTFVPRGSVWKYHDSGEDLGANWTHPDYDDSSWKEGAAPLGYAGPVTTTVRYGTNPSAKYITTYFRRAFMVESGDLARLTVSLRRDDGGIVYLNGREVFRSNMPAGPVRFDTRASSTVGGAAETSFFVSDAPPALLLTGTNLLAVEIHQANPSSSDLAFDLQLEGESARIFPVPKLSWKRAGDHLELAWPAHISGWRLQAAPVLEAYPGWRPHVPEPSYHHGSFRVELPLAETRQFFILSRVE